MSFAVIWAGMFWRYDYEDKVEFDVLMRILGIDEHYMAAQDILRMEIGDFYFHGKHIVIRRS